MTLHIPLPQAAPSGIETVSLAEARHRARNLVSLAIALANQSLASIGTDPAVVAFIDRLHSLDAVARLGSDVDDRFCMLHKVARRVTARMDDPAHPRIRCDGPDVALSSRWAHLLAIMFHELGANAVRYGALASQAGQVDVRWTIGQVDADRFDLIVSWRESNGPPPPARRRRGFGTHLLCDVIGGNRRCHATLDFPPTGLVYRLVIGLRGDELDL